MSLSPLILIGASTRAAAQSARRAGFDPFCVDQFADEDLRECATLLPCQCFPDDLIGTLSRAPDAPWLYTGGLENQPELVDQLAEIRPLLGNRSQALSLVRDPLWVAETLRRFNRPALQVVTQSLSKEAASLAPNCRWLKKPLSSAGGRGINFVNPTEASIAVGHYVQEFAEGLVISGLFVADGRNARLCGVARQLIGESISNAPSFGYCGSIAPLDERDLPASAMEQVADRGALFAREAGLLGLFGIDFVWDAACQIAWVLEINPRYTASAELFELAGCMPLIGQHVAASNGVLSTIPECDVTPSTDRCGKLVLYAPSALVAPDLRGWRSLAHDAWIADVPTPGSSIEIGLPVCTVLARGRTTADCYERLVNAAALVSLAAP